MIRYIIDYRVGGMGNTIAAHIMYACDQLNLDLDSFFSETGDAHAARPFYSKPTSQLVPMHINENPELFKQTDKCVLEIKFLGWHKLIEIYMGYVKFKKTVPTVDNILDYFFNLTHVNHDKDTLWNEFYNNIKAESWPECSWNDVDKLPTDIREEVLSRYQLPDSDVTLDNFVSLLTIAYYDNLNTPNRNMISCYGGTPYSISDYLAGNVDELKNISKLVGWQWSSQKSAEFLKRVLIANEKYFKWLENIREISSKINTYEVFDTNLDDWEWALLLAQKCKELGIHPKELPLLVSQGGSSTFGIVNFLRKYHGKTV